MHPRHLATSRLALLAAIAIAPLGETLAQDQPFPVEIRVGATLDVCTTGRVVCPAMYPRCDDPKVAAPVVDHLDGGRWRLGLQGIGAGTTICSVLSQTGARQVFSVTVR
ncbi:MAG TPA: hypothetical protein VFF02_15910 [Anaeromyxobacteraceae bacterium]|nr:hypothetical protein [Anaeromyxobacteraceae bacterium]